MGCELAIEEVRTQGDLVHCYVKDNAGLKMANADKARLRSLLQPKPSLWQRVFHTESK